MMSSKGGSNPPLPAPRRGHLTEAEDRLLRALIADRPGLTEGQIIALFRARTGRTLNHTAVQRRRKARPPGPGNGNLAEAGRATLARLVRESWGEASCRDIAAQFAALAGRPISAQSVWRFAVGTLGMPRVGKGRTPRLRPGAVAARLAEAGACARERDRARRERAKVDRSPRVGRSGRFRPGGPQP